MICYDEDYIKVWNVSLGKLKSTHDYSRKKIAQAFIMRDGKLLIIRQKKDNKVVLLDLEHNYEKTIYEGEEESKM